MRVGIIDAEIVGKSKHRFPNLASMKISAYHKKLGDDVSLLTDYSEADSYDLVYISKVFIKTNIPLEDNTQSEKNEQNAFEYYSKNEFLKKKNIKYGGTGFFYDKAPNLPYEIEHSMPDYDLYKDWVDEKIKNGARESEFVYYKDYSIGFLTRGCFRQCEFCVNKKYKKCERHSDITEFMDIGRSKLCFLDDNFFACPEWRDIIKEVEATGKRFRFKQGLDERLLNEEKVKKMREWKYDGKYIFAFDNIEDRDMIKSKMDLLYSIYPDWKKEMTFYCFCGFDRNNKYDNEFWLNDIRDLLERFMILGKYSAHPYVMRHENYKMSPYSHIYDCLAAWANQPFMYYRTSFETFCKCSGMTKEGYKKYKTDFDGYLKEYGKKNSRWRYYDEFNRQTNNMFEDMFHIIPFSLAEHGTYAKQHGQHN